MTVVQIICLIVVLLLAVVAGFLIAKKSKEHSLVKWIGLFIILAMVLTWIVPPSQGFYYSTELTIDELSPIGFSDIPNLIYNVFYMVSDKIIFLLALGAFYGVLSKSKGYKKLVSTIAEKLKGKEILFAIISSLLIAVMTSLFVETFAVLIFVPFIISIALQLKLDKMSAFAITFGSMLIGLLGLTYGSDGLYWFNQYISTTYSNGLLYRILVLTVAFVLFSFFNVIHINKVLKEKNVDETKVDPYAVSNVDKKSRSIFAIIGSIVLFIVMLCVFIDWKTNFGIELFGTIHSWLIDLKIGSYPIGKYLLGSLATNTAVEYLRRLYLYLATAIMIVAMLIIAIVGRIKLNDFISGIGEGIKKILTPLALYMGVVLVMLASYACMYVPTIVNTFAGLSHSFNPFIAALAALVSSVFYTDFGLIGFSVATYFTATYASNINVIALIFTTMYGFVQLLLPTSAILMIGLSYLKIDYKAWLKYIWIFLISIFVILLVLYTIMTYI